ncbi:TBC1 domain family member 1 isoform X1, partial [Tachysurus ichikawai]
DVVLVEPPSPPLLLPPSSPLRSHNSTGDLKCLETSEVDQEGHDPQAQSFRRRASTISHSPSMCTSSLNVPSEQAAAGSKPKLVRHYSVSTDSPHQSNRSFSSPFFSREHSTCPHQGGSRRRCSFLLCFFLFLTPFLLFLSNLRETDEAKSLRAVHKTPQEV